MAVRVAIAGLGLRGRQWGEALRRIPGAEVAACVDVSEDALRGAAAALGIPSRRCFVRLDEALDETRPDAVIVATSIDSHVEPSRAVLARRIPLLVEKPFALTLREARGLAAMAADARVPVVVGQTYRYTGMTQVIKNALAAGTVGRVGLVVYQVYRGNRYLRPAVAALPNGVLWETAVHHIDLLRYLLRQEVVAAAAESFALPWSQVGPGAAMHVALTFADGVRALLVATYDSRPASSLQFVGEYGTLVPRRRWLMLTGRGTLPRIVAAARHQSPEPVLFHQLRRAMETGEEPECSARDNLQTVAVLEACARSAAEGRMINPQDLFDEAV